MTIRILAAAICAAALGLAAAHAQTPSTQTAAGQTTPAQPAAAQTAPAQPSPTEGAPAARPADVASPEALVAACYDVISGPAGPRDWSRFRSLFLPSARMTVAGVGKDGAVHLRVLGIDDYVARAGGAMAKEGFVERGVRNQTLRWGHTATVRSVYESRHAAGDATPFAGGVNTFNLVNDGGRWWVASLQWEASSPSLAVPTDLAR